MERQLFSDVSEDKVFYLQSGKPIRNISELTYSLKNIDDNEFSHHANFEKDDFATWIDDAIGAKEFASKLRNIKDRNLYIEYLDNALNPKKNSEVKPQAEISKKTNEVNELIKVQAPNSSNTNVIIANSNKDSNKKNIPLKKVEKIVPVTKNPKKILTVNKISPKITENNIQYSTSSKDTSKLQSEIDKLSKMNSDLNLKLDAITKLLASKDALEPQIQNTVAKNVSKYFDDKDFRKKVIEIFRGTIKEDIETENSKHRHVIKSEVNSVISMNNELEKKLDITIAHRNKQIEEAIKQGVSEIIDTKTKQLNSRIDKMFESRLSKLAENATKKSSQISQNSILKYKKDIESEKHDLKQVSLEVMHKEFQKLLDNDEQVSKLVGKYQRMFSEGMEHTSKTYKDSADKFNDELIGIKDKIILEAFHNLNKNLSETIKKQREVLDSELSKTLNSNKFFISRFEKEVLHKEKLLLESADRKLDENYRKHNGMLNSEYSKYSRELKDITNEFGKNIKNTENQLFNSINNKVHESINKEFNDVVINQRDELNKSLNNARLTAIESINKDFGELLSKHKSFMIEQFNKSSNEQKGIKDEFALQLKTEKDKILSEVKETMQKDLMITINSQRDILDKELAKTISSNKFFIDRFENDIATITDKMHKEADKVFEDKYTKYSELLKTASVKQNDSIKEVITEADQSFSQKESQVFEKLNSIINTNVRQAVNTEFTRLITEEKQALQTELDRAKEFNETMEQKFENSLKEKEEELIKNVTEETRSKFNDIISMQQQKLDEELSEMKKSYKQLEAKKQDIMTRANNLFDHVESYSKDKLKNLAKEHDKHIQKVSKISVLVDRTEKALADIQELKEDIKKDKKQTSKGNEEYKQLISDLSILKSSLEEEHKKIKSTKYKDEVHELINKCNEHILSKDIKSVKSAYDQIINIYNNSKDLDKKERAQLYKDIQALLEKIQTTFAGMINQ